MFSIDSYFERLGTRSANDLEDLYHILLAKCDDKYARKIIDYIQNRGNKPNKDDNFNFYDFKNSSFEGSLALAVAFDCDYYQKSFKYILSNADKLGKRILIIGCDVGVDACFFAKSFEYKEFLAIDICESAINNAKQLSKVMKLNNIKFEAISFEDLNDTFDCIISLRTIHENFVFNEEENYSRLPFTKRACYFSKGFDDYFKTVSRCLVNGGFFLGVERLSDHDSFCAALSSQKNSLRLLDRKSITANELDNTCNFIEFSFKKELCDFDNVTIWKNTFEKTNPFIVSETYHGDYAEYYLEKYAVRLEDGYCLRAVSEDLIIVIIGIFYIDPKVNDKKLMIYYDDANGLNLYWADKNDLDSVKTQIENDLKNKVSSDIKLEKFDFSGLNDRI